MEVHEQLHSDGGRAFADLHRGLDVTVAAAEPVAVCIERIVPDAYANGVDAVLRKRQQQILRFAGKVVIGNAAVFLGDDGRNVHPEKKLLRKVLYLLDVQAAALNFFGRNGGNGLLGGLLGSGLLGLRLRKPGYRRAGAGGRQKHCGKKKQNHTLERVHRQVSFLDVMGLRESVRR